MVIFGLLALLLGLAIGSGLLFWLGLILVIVGLVANAVGHASSPRRRYW